MRANDEGGASKELCRLVFAISLSIRHPPLWNFHLIESEFGTNSSKGGSCAMNATSPPLIACTVLSLSESDIDQMEVFYRVQHEFSEELLF